MDLRNSGMVGNEFGMKRSYRILLSIIMAICVLIIPTHSCEKDDNNNPTNGRTTAVFNPEKAYGSLTDQDGNEYKTITIGKQTWMAENLRTTKYRNGDEIPGVTEENTWFNLGTGAFCNYHNTINIDSIATYGRLYNWYAANDSRNIAPPGWHVPTHDEWIILETYLTDSVAGIKLKESDTVHWKIHYYIGTNETGFTALGAGYRQGYAGKFTFINIGIESGWWTVTEGDDNIDNAYHVTMGYNYGFLGGCNCTKVSGYSIRCVKD
jgi:uncharacterized protein (TIGR02145 family)